MYYVCMYVRMYVCKTHTHTRIHTSREERDCSQRAQATIVFASRIDKPVEGVKIRTETTR